MAKINPTSPKFTLIPGVVVKDASTLTVTLMVTDSSHQPVEDKDVVFYVDDVIQAGQNKTDVNGKAARDIPMKPNSGLIKIKMEVQGGGYKEVSYNTGTKAVQIDVEKIKLSVVRTHVGPGIEQLNFNVYNNSVGMEATLRFMTRCPVKFDGVTVPPAGQNAFDRKILATGMPVRLETDIPVEIDILVLGYKISYQLDIPGPGLAPIKATSTSDPLAQLFKRCV